MTTVSVPLLPLAALGGWASASTYLWIAAWCRCHRRHCGITADGDLIAWDETPAAPAAAAERGHHTEKAAS